MELLVRSVLPSPREVSVQPEPLARGGAARAGWDSPGVDMGAKSPIAVGGKNSVGSPGDYIAY